MRARAVRIGCVLVSVHCSCVWAAFLCCFGAAHGSHCSVLPLTVRSVQQAADEEVAAADEEVAAAADEPWEAAEEEEEPKLGRTHEMLSSSRVWRRRVGERRITAPVRVVNAFVLALVRLPPPEPTL
eukprot:COSAG02_NODE_3186_length_7217_cov_3.288848_1_plen_127_part_00